MRASVPLQSASFINMASVQVNEYIGSWVVSSAQMLTRDSLLLSI